jgi:hypothetical protein
MPTNAEIRADAQALLVMASVQNLNAVLAAALVAKNDGAPLASTLTTQQLLDASAYAMNNAPSDLLSITVNQWMKFLENASGGLQSVVAGSGVTVDDTDPLNPVVSATGGGGGAGSIVLLESDTFSVNWVTVFGGLTSGLHGGQCFEAQFDLISGASGTREATDILLVWSTDLSQAEGSSGSDRSKKIPIAVGIRGSAGTYADWRVIFHTMPCPDTSDLTPGFRPYNNASGVTISATETYRFAIYRVQT